MRLTRSFRASAAPGLLTCLALAVMAVPATARLQTKPCARIGQCATAVRPPLVQSQTQRTLPSSHFDVAVKAAPTSTAGTANQPGTLVTNQLVGHRIACAGYAERSDTALAFQLRTASPLHITYVITDRLVNTTANGIELCLAAPFAFKTLSGKPAAPTTLPDGTPGHVGVLPGCATVPATAPCLVSATPEADPNHSTTGVDVILKARVPSTTKGADPWIRP